MNTRIDELAWQAGCHKTMQHDPVRPEGSGWIIDQETLDKFAELIVSECMKVAHYHTPDTDDLDYGWLIRNEIANHFGIPE
jgi:hypothetical protein